MTTSSYDEFTNIRFAFHSTTVYSTVEVTYARGENRSDGVEGGSH